MDHIVVETFLPLRIRTGSMAKTDLLPRNDVHRRIIHLDMDAFYASVELRDYPELARKAVVVAYDPREHHGHGVITTANYQARKYGVGSAMPAIDAVRLVPANELVFVPPHFEKYHVVSNQVRSVMREVTDLIDPVALDEAYLDVTQNKLGTYSAIALGAYLQRRVYQVTGLTASFGVSYNKILAKMGSEYAKPFGRTIILPEEAVAFLGQQDIATFPGIGKKTQVILHQLGLNTGHDLQQQPVEWFLRRFKKQGYQMAMHAWGIDLRPVLAHRQRKSLGKEQTYNPSLFTQKAALAQLEQQSQRVSQALKKQHLVASCVTLKIRNAKFETMTHQVQLKRHSDDASAIYLAVRELFLPLTVFWTSGIRLLGVSCSQLKAAAYAQIDLFKTSE